MMNFKIISYACSVLCLSSSLYGTQHITNENIEGHHITRGSNGLIQITDGVIDDLNARLLAIEAASDHGDLAAVKRKWGRLQNDYEDDSFFKAVAPFLEGNILYWVSLFPRDKDFLLSQEDVHFIHTSTNEYGHNGLSLNFEGLITLADGQQILMAYPSLKVNFPYKAYRAEDIISRICKAKNVALPQEESGKELTHYYTKLTMEKELREIKREVKRDLYNPNQKNRKRGYKPKNNRGNRLENNKFYQPNNFRAKKEYEIDYVEENVLKQEIVSVKRPARLALSIYQGNVSENYYFDDIIDLTKLYSMFGNNQILIDIRHR